MKLFSIAAAGLLLGGSALAMAPASAEALDTHGKPVVTMTDEEIIAQKLAYADAYVPAPGETKESMAATGVGGPYEADGFADLRARPAADNYPPCSPGPGDDRCIQLYEPGVRTALASWTGATGGLAGSGEAVAMGGPYEAADVHGHAGMGGPVEARDGYPPCSPGPGDDRCIQLYERGVTGRGN